MYDGGELCKDIGIGFGRIRIFPHGQLYDREPERPYIGRYCIRPEVILGFALDALGLQTIV